MERKLAADIRRLSTGSLSHELSSRYLWFDHMQMWGVSEQATLKITAIPATAKMLKKNTLNILHFILSYC